MDNNTLWFEEQRLKRTKISLEKNNYEVHIINNKSQVVEKLKDILEKGSTVSFGGSMTLLESNVFELLKDGDYNLLDRNKEGLTPQEKEKIYRQSFFADYYITSSNAITEGGELVNLDGRGNRVAAMIYGPKKVVIIAGYNKIVKNLDEAYERVRNYVAPINAKRLKINTPCYITGKCEECLSEQRICNHYVVTYRQNTKYRGLIILIREKMGY